MGCRRVDKRGFDVWDAVHLEPGETPIAHTWLTLKPKIRGVRRQLGHAFITDKRFVFVTIFGPGRRTIMEFDFASIVEWRLDQSDPRRGRIGLEIGVPDPERDGPYFFPFYPAGPLPEDEIEFFKAFVAAFERANPNARGPF